MMDSLGNRIPKNAIILRHTEVPDFRNCRLPWVVASHNGMNLEPLVSNEKLRFGTCWHGGLEAYYRRLLQGNEPSDYTEIMKQGFMEEYDKQLNKIQLNLGAAYGDPELLEKLKAEKELGMALSESYIDWVIDNPPEDLEISDKDLQVLAVEWRIVVPLYNPFNQRKSKIYIAAKLDTVVAHGERLLVLEHKTASKATDVNNNPLLQLDLQMGIQLYVLREFLRKVKHPTPLQKIMQSKKLSGAIYNVTRKQAPSSKVKNPLHGRQRVLRSNLELDNLGRELFLDGGRMRNCIKHPSTEIYTNPEPYAGSKCSWKCAIKSICEARNRGEDYQFLLNQKFKPRDKDIWQLLEEETKES